MQFAKGSRFALEKTTPSKHSETLAPRTSTTISSLASRHSRSPTVTGELSGDDRYAVLLKRVKDLERVHADDKKQHLAELDCYKSELARATKTSTEQLEKFDRLKQRNQAADLRIHELKKNSATEQAEIKELRAKLRMSEHERNQLASKLKESGDAKTAISNVEAKRRENVKDRRVAELERAVAVERKKREMLESCVDEEAVKLRADAESLKEQLDAARQHGQDAQQAASAARNEAEERGAELLAQLDQCRVALSCMAEEYGHLASTTVTNEMYTALKEEHVALRIRSLRLERKLANSEGQVTELANLIRQTKEENDFLSQQLQDAEWEIAISQPLRESGLDYIAQPHDSISCLENELIVLRVDITQNQGLILEALLEYHAAAHDFYLSQTNSVLLQVDELECVSKQEQAANRALAEEVANHVALHEASYAELQKLQTELVEANHVLAKDQVSLAEIRRSRDDLQDQVDQIEQRLSQETSQHQATLQKERDVVQKLTTQLHMSKTVEETLRAEVEQLNIELVDTSRFQDAYYTLLDEAEGLLARNNLAEEEAERLSRFNAEILGHHNPAQKIVYVDRIRRELAETKQQLLVCTRDRDTLAAANEDFRHELELYTSSMVPTDDKPRSLFTRVSRQPLTSQGLDMGNAQMSPSFSAGGTEQMMVEHLPEPGDMTLDELV
ncbi:hypothetical protein PAXRUDRAFT_821407 [Paxillus rubicundulus Ve08.2h10]|uniref:Unplaced genomic scaffold scaffold_6, whole genome shotgun sequence n=1 Tax=Paxillus rubicundulus Ve08.2h10 TaxID=930991 RepID=A0A0D0DNY1_9AGAM|nr:hypothetical protein PAXRUDRAFT_821407 [Paxillus rubicundulus Ve08.2h10]